MYICMHVCMYVCMHVLYINHMCKSQTFIWVGSCDRKSGQTTVGETACLYNKPWIIIRNHSQIREVFCWGAFFWTCWTVDGGGAGTGHEASRQESAPLQHTASHCNTLLQTATHCRVARSNLYLLCAHVIFCAHLHWSITINYTLKPPPSAA